MFHDILYEKLTLHHLICIVYLPCPNGQTTPLGLPQNHKRNHRTTRVRGIRLGNVHLPCGQHLCPPICGSRIHPAEFAHGCLKPRRHPPLLHVGSGNSLCPKIGYANDRRPSEQLNRLLRTLFCIKHCIKCPYLCESVELALHGLHSRKERGLQLL